MQRIAVIGTSGSGKTTLARALSARLNLPHIEIDSIYWQPAWTTLPRDVFVERVTNALAADRWTIDGNYSAVRELIWTRADTIIWLDYPMPIVLFRVIQRTIRRCFTRERLWNGNRERLAVQLFTRDSIVWWSIETWRRLRRDYAKLLMHQARRGTHIVRFRSPGQTREWLATLDGLSTEGAVK